MRAPKSPCQICATDVNVHYAGQGMLPSEESFFKNGRVNKEALVDFIKTIKKNTNLSDEDAAIMAASKVSKTNELKILVFYHHIFVISKHGSGGCEGF